MTVIESELGKVLDVLAGIDQQAIRYEVKKLRAIRDWALSQLNLGYGVGDRVRIVDGWTFDPVKSPGWAAYREVLSPGARATVLEIDFNAVHGYWYADIMLDREWSTSSDGRRWWHGPVEETPEGMDPPSAFDQERYPAGRKHTFALRATALERVDDGTATNDTTPS